MLKSLLSLVMPSPSQTCVKQNQIMNAEGLARGFVLNHIAEAKALRNYVKISRQSFAVNIRKTDAFMF